jgi:signal peptidase II
MIPIIISVVVMLIIVVLDQVSKYLIVSHFGMIEQIYVQNLEIGAMDVILAKLPPLKIIPGVLNFRLVLNDGAALGMLDNARWVFLVLSTVAIIAILVYLFWKKPQNKLLLVALTLVTGGGIGNMIDRVWLGYVVDFIDFCAFPKLWMWVFNVADSCVTVGAGILALWMIIDLIKDIKAENAAKLAAAQDVVPENSAETDGENEDDRSEE